MVVEVVVFAIHISFEGIKPQVSVGQVDVKRKRNFQHLPSSETLRDTQFSGISLEICEEIIKSRFECAPVQNGVLKSQGIFLRTFSETWGMGR